MALALALTVCLLTVIASNAQEGNQAPQFLPGGDMQGFALREDTPVGSSVYTLRGSDPEGTDVSFSVSGDYLSVDRNSGVVTLVQPLDRENISSIEAIITVTDGRVFGRESNTVPIRLDIPIIDVNDNRPVFKGTPYFFKVSESVTPGATLFSEISIHDADAGLNSQISLTCIEEESPEACGLFEVREAKTGDGSYIGVISLGASLDFEKKTAYTIKLRAEDGGGLVSTSSVEVQVEDIQDQPPVLLNAPYSASVKEGTPPGVVVLDIIARDGDLGEPQPLRLSLEGDDSGYFTLHDVQRFKDGDVRATLVTSKVPLDREDPIIVQNGGIYTFYLRADEEGGRRESTRSKVIIVVMDEDDQKPYFNEEEAFVSVSENLADGTPLPGLDLVVTDEDVGENAQFSLQLQDVSNSKGVFAVFPETAMGRTPVIIKVINGSALDFENENANKFAFRVVVSQNGKAISSALVRVNVTDANDNAPAFAYLSYRFSVEEGAPPYTSIAILQANDSDSASFGEMSYSLKGFGAEKFLVNASTGEIFVSPCGVHSTCLDFEHQSIYSLTYSATDGGGRVTSVNVFINVVDVNDNPPTFDRVEYRRTVDEGAAYFDPPLFVKATDIDGKEQGAGVVTYALHDGNTADNAFTVNFTTGEVIIKRPLTHMDTPSSIYTLTIRATDAGSPPRHNDVRVHITVGRDKNRPPRFSKQMYLAKIPENARAGTQVITVKARDPDGSDAAILYHLGSGGGDHFTLNETTGLIAVSKGAVLDRDVEPYYQLVVVAVDGGQETQQSSSAIVNVTLLDVNDKPPVFNKKSYVGHVNERSSLGDIILRVGGTDPDDNALLVYNISAPIFAYDKTGVTLKENSAYDFSSAFSVNKTTGDVFVSGKLDHNEASVIVFNVIVLDTMADADYPLQNDTTEVTIYIQVFSNKNPIFPSPWTPGKPFLEVFMNEEEPTGEKVFSVAAKDPISGHFVRRYEKVRDSDPQNIFNLDPLTGQVSLNSKLDYEKSETKRETFDVLAIAGDRTSQATMVVNIKDINDNNPQFIENEYHVRLEEDARWPKTVLEVSASDADTEERGKVQYSLGGEDKLLFVINETTGKIQVARGAQLDRETTPTVNLEVTAYDTPTGGVTQRKTTVIVKIELIDVNDETPIWSKNGKYTAVVAENTPVGTVVSEVEASDPDLGVNGLVTYQIPEMQGSLDGLFGVNPETGVITVRSPLNGKGRTAPYELGVRALDQGTPQQFSEVKVTLYIGDVSLNDGVPVFIKPKPNEVATVMENSRQGTAVFQVEALDADSSDTANGKIVYSFLESPAKEGPFQIDASTGLITTRGKLDREVQDQHSVVVVAQDLGRPPQLTSRVLLINVTDADDNDPVFVKLPGKESAELEVEEEAATGTIVGYVNALDRDIGINALIDYKITYGNDENLLGIKRTEDNKGKIFVKGRIDREKISEIVLTVACGKLGQRLPDRVPYDSSDPSLLQVIIKVRDLDDNRPKFEDSEFTTGVRVDSPLQTEILHLKAEDKDPTSMPIRYTLHNASITRIKENNIKTSEIINGSDVFLLEEITGILRTRASLKMYSSNTFTLYIAAASNPMDKPAYAKVLIYVLRDSELLRFVFDRNPRDIRNRIPQFLSEVQKVLPVPDSLDVYDTNYYDDAEGKINYEKTGSCFQLVGRSLEDTKKLLDSSENQKLKNVFDKYHVSSVEPCQPRRLSRASIDWVEIWVLVIAAFVGAGAALASCAVCCLYSRYKRRLRRNLHHMRLLDSPQLVPMTPSSIHPGSIVMLPPPGMAPPPMGPPMMIGHEPPRGYEWQERALPLDAVSFGTGNGS